jgi:Uma2 family endonuclease
MAIQEKLLTADEFWAEYEDKRVELVKGVPVEMAPASHLHGDVAARIVFYLMGYVLENDLGGVFGAETGFLLRRNPDVLRAADASFIAKERLAAIEDPNKYTPFPPDLAVEVISPYDRAADILAKINDFIEGGVRLMWVIYPSTRQVMVYRPGHDPILLKADGELSGYDVLPGFALQVARLFPD